MCAVLSTGTMRAVVTASRETDTSEECNFYSGRTCEFEISKLWESIEWHFAL